MKKNKAIFLDRDGVINKLVLKNGKARAPYSIEDLELFPGVIEACQQLKNLNYFIIVVTNQPDMVRGLVTRESIDIINAKILECLLIDDIQICFHDNEDKCLCRKPKPGMLLEAALKWEIDLEKSFMIGDRYGDIAAGVSSGCRTILVGEGDIQGHFPTPNYQVTSLLEASFIIESLQDDLNT
ncbi:MAG: HAD family hydrolase [Bacteriovorax sp.]|nr:HAD family hydrolase [Bacteriovorax sp.]